MKVHLCQKHGQIRPCPVCLTEGFLAFMGFGASLFVLVLLVQFVVQLAAMLLR